MNYRTTETWHELAKNRTAWRQAVKKGVRSFEAERLKARADKRQKRKAKEALNIQVQQNPASADFVCQTCDRAMQQIKNWPLLFYSHSTTTLTSSKSMSPLPPLRSEGTYTNW